MSYTASLSSLKRVSGTTKTASVKPAPSDSERPSRMSVQEKWARDRKSLFDNKRNSDAAPPLVRRLELARFSFMSIGAIDCIGQFFRAQIFFELRFPGGAKDPDLSAPGDEFAIRNGEPRPPAGWYMKQIDLKNFIEHNDPLNANVKREGDDLYLSMRFEGEVILRPFLCRAATIAAFPEVGWSCGASVPHCSLPATLLLSFLRIWNLSPFLSTCRSSPSI